MSPSESHTDQTELERMLRSTKPWFAENGTTLIYALAAVLAVAAVIVFLQRQSAGDIQASQELLLATAPEQYRDIADNFPETTIGVWARLRQGDRLLDNAVGNMFTNREVAIEELEQAAAAYQRLAERTDVDEQVRERVLIGLARVAEARCDGQPESTNAAVAAWQRVLDEFSDSIVKQHAEERVQHLQSDESKSFYAWFHELNPTPVDPGLAPGQPAVPDLPSLHNLNIPMDEGSGDKAPAEGAAGDDVPAEKAETPAAENSEEPKVPAEPAKSAPESDTKPPADTPDKAEDDVPPTGDNKPTSEEPSKTDEPAAADSPAATDDSAAPGAADKEQAADSDEPASGGGDDTK